MIRNAPFEVCVASMEAVWPSEAHRDNVAGLTNVRALRTLDNHGPHEWQLAIADFQEVWHAIIDIHSTATISNINVQKCRPCSISVLHHVGRPLSTPTRVPSTCQHNTATDFRNDIANVFIFMPRCLQQFHHLEASTPSSRTPNTYAGLWNPDTIINDLDVESSGGEGLFQSLPDSETVRRGVYQ